MKIQKLILLILFGWFGLSFTTKAQPGEPIPDLKAFCSQQKGFNLLGKFDVSWSNTGFTQKEFSVIRDLGFNFVRLPLDYRTYTLAGNWDVFTESQLVNIDQAVEWGRQYKIHVCINSDWPVPHWPMLWVSNYFYGPWKSEYRSTLTIQGNFAQGAEIIVNVQQVSIESTLQVKAGTKIVLTKKFVCGPDLGTDFTKIVNTRWGYQNISNKDYAVTLAASANSLAFENVSGDWMTINSISIKQGDAVKTYSLSDNTWGRKQETYKMDANGVLKTLDGNDLLPFKDYQKTVNMANQNNIPIMVQEFGVHNQTPHKVSVAFLTDLSAFFRQNNLGWALWNLTGSFGILNSSRTDYTYESYQGYKLDRAMLDALTKSGTTNATGLKKQNLFKLYPSPAKDNLFLSAENFSGTTKIEIRDITGRLIKSIFTETIAAEITKLDVSGMNPGLYLLSATNNGKQITGKFLVEQAR